MHPLDRWFRLRLPVAAGAILTTVLLVGWFTQPDRYALGYTPDQPIAFSHKLHAGDNKVPCLYCHTGADRSRHAGVPPLDTCMNCHRYARTDKPAIQKITALYEKGETLAWNRIYDLPGHVYFDHRPHVRAGIACQECHGPVETMDKVRRVMNMRMGQCLACHRGEHAYLVAQPSVRRAPEECSTCHR
jgi:c(7)-type cytochrome triheme protein